MTNVSKFKTAEQLSQEQITDDLAETNERIRSDIEENQIRAIVTMEYREDGMTYDMAGDISLEDVYCDMDAIKCDIMDVWRGLSDE